MFSAIRFLLVLTVVSVGFSAKADSGGYKVYSDASGNIYLEAPKTFVLLHGGISVPIPARMRNGFFKLSQSAGQWQLTVMTETEWFSQSKTVGSTLVKSISYADVNDDGFPDINITFSSDQSSITITGLTASATIAAPANVVIYLHTNVLGSVIAESDSKGNIIKKTEYEPFGKSSD